MHGSHCWPRWHPSASREYDEQIENIAKSRYPEIELLKQVHGVGTLTALTYVLTVEDPYRFRRSLDAGA